MHAVRVIIFYIYNLFDCFLDDMGLGKTLQTVALIWTLMKQVRLKFFLFLWPIFTSTILYMETVQSPVAGSVVTKKILVVAPSSLLNNWASEFRKWLGSERLVSISILKVVSSEKVGGSGVTSALGTWYGGVVMGVLLSFDEAAILYRDFNIAPS